MRKTDVYECISRAYGFEPMPEELNLFVDKMQLKTLLQDEDEVTLRDEVNHSPDIIA